MRPLSSLSRSLSLFPAGLVPLFALSAFVLEGCKKAPPTQSLGTTGSASTASAPSGPPPVPPARLTGSALAREVKDKALYLADEDAGLVRRVPLPLTAEGPFVELKLAGPPAQIIAREKEILVTVRDPSALVVLVDETEARPDGTLREVAKLDLPGDAWGMALSPDERTLLVTSAWTHQVSIIDVRDRKVLATLDVAREPRGAVFTPDGKRAFVTHLMGTALTRIEIAGAASTLRSVALPAGVTRAPKGSENSASNGFALAVSPDGSRLFAPRHALGGLSFDAAGGWSGGTAWWGASAVDVLLLRDETPLIPKRASVAMLGRFGAAEGMPKVPTPPEAGALPLTAAMTFVQPRDALYRKSTNTLLVVSEGGDSLHELDAEFLDPALGEVQGYAFSAGYLTGKTKQPTADKGSAPAAVAMSEDESIAYVWSRGSREIQGFGLRAERSEGKPAITPSLAGPFPEPMSAEAAAGRRLFAFASDEVMSGGLGCAGCHPDGRDDGFVWREGRHRPAEAATKAGEEGGKPAEGTQPAESTDKGRVFYAHPTQLFDPENEGRARQTPMLAGRVAADGPFGWHAQNKDLETRLLDGFGLHRWRAGASPTAYEKAFRLKQLKAYLRTGLRPPPKDSSPLTPEQEKGKALFEDDKTLCKTCHPGATEFTTRAPVPLKSPLPTRAGFFPDEDQSFKVPSLLFVGGTAPYYHDGSASSLTELVEKNGTRMGSTAHLSAEERKALVAYLERL